jgi:hypothetical protein
MAFAETGNQVDPGIIAGPLAPTRSLSFVRRWPGLTPGHDDRAGWIDGNAAPSLQNPAERATSSKLRQAEAGEIPRAVLNL